MGRFRISNSEARDRRYMWHSAFECWVLADESSATIHIVRTHPEELRRPKNTLFLYQKHIFGRNFKTSQYFTMSSYDLKNFDIQKYGPWASHILIRDVCTMLPEVSKWSRTPPHLIRGGPFSISVGNQAVKLSGPPLIRGWNKYAAFPDLLHISGPFERE